MSGPRRVLVIDDNDDIAELVCAAAESLKMTCEATTTVDDFVAALTVETDLILMDMMMPEMNGRELLAMLAGRRCKAGIVLISGVGPVALREAEAHGRDLGLKMAGVLAKPFRVPELLALLKQ
jgi:CheY-like chemotaxis protein